MAIDPHPTGYIAEPNKSTFYIIIYRGPHRWLERPTRTDQILKADTWKEAQSFAAVFAGATVHQYVVISALAPRLPMGGGLEVAREEYWQEDNKVYRKPWQLGKETVADLSKIVYPEPIAEEKEESFGARIRKAKELWKKARPGETLVDVVRRQTEAEFAARAKASTEELFKHGTARRGQMTLGGEQAGRRPAEEKPLPPEEKETSLDEFKEPPKEEEYPQGKWMPYRVELRRQKDDLVNTLGTGLGLGTGSFDSLEEAKKALERLYVNIEDRKRSKWDYAALVQYDPHTSEKIQVIETLGRLKGKIVRAKDPAAYENIPPIFFNVKEAREQLLNKGFVYTLRKKRAAGVTIARFGSLYKFDVLGKVRIEEVATINRQVMGSEIVKQLEPYVGGSGFPNVTWWMSAARFHDKLIDTIYKVTLLTPEAHEKDSRGRTLTFRVYRGRIIDDKYGHRQVFDPDFRTSIREKAIEKYREYRADPETNKAGIMVDFGGGSHEPMAMWSSDHPERNFENLGEAFEKEGDGWDLPLKNPRGYFTFRQWVLRNKRGDVGTSELEYMVDQARQVAPDLTANEARAKVEAIHARGAGGPSELPWSDIESGIDWERISEKEKMGELAKSRVDEIKQELQQLREAGAITKDEESRLLGVSIERLTSKQKEAYLARIAELERQLEQLKKPPPTPEEIARQRREEERHAHDGTKGPIPQQEIDLLFNTFNSILTRRTKREPFPAEIQKFDELVATIQKVRPQLKFVQARIQVENLARQIATTATAGRIILRRGQARIDELLEAMLTRRLSADEEEELRRLREGEERTSLEIIEYEPPNIALIAESGPERNPIGTVLEPTQPGQYPRVVMRTWEMDNARENAERLGKIGYKIRIEGEESPREI